MTHIKRVNSEVRLLKTNGFHVSDYCVAYNSSIDGNCALFTFHVEMGERYPFKSPAIYISTPDVYKCFYFKYGDLTVTVPGSDEQHFQINLSSWCPSIKLYELLECVEKELATILN